VTVLVIQHLPHEHSGVLGEVLAVAGVPVVTCRAWTGVPVPADPTGYDAIVVLGGDMNTDEEDQWPHLAAVRELLAEAVEHTVPVLAICLGAQLLAEAVGGEVHHGTPEIGYIPIRWTPSGSRHPVLSVVADDFISVPSRATLLAFSDAAAVHAFEVGSALGLQFHPEIDASFVAAYVEAEGVAAYLSDNGWTPEALLTAARRHNETHRLAGRRLFTAWLTDVGA
jgi:GMP synthase (glutamine-hydrolysing)